MSAAAELLRRLAALGVEPASVTDDSRLVRPGDLFLAYPGDAADGRRYVADAIARGAAAILYEAEGASLDAPAVPAIAVRHLRALAGNVAHAVLGEPSERLSLIAVTGTNGKTSCTQWIARAHPRRCAIVGTLGAGFPGDLDETGFTTPQATTLARCLDAFLEQGAEACALEASSIGIEEGRLNGAHVDIAAFTNLTRDHLDYHGTMKAYAAAKEKLFRWPGLRAAVINLDDPFGEHLAKVGNARLKVGYTMTGATASVDLLLAASDIRVEPSGMAFTLRAPQGTAAIESRLVGRYNVANLLAVAGVLLAGGLPFEELAPRLARLEPPPGRMQRVGGDGQPLVVIDYAHSPDALDNALAALREEAAARGGRLVCVFGCGGDRDPGKRPLMGEVAARGADRVVLTSDNPRSESPAAIVDAIRGGAPQAEVIVDRRQAIAATIGGAAPTDVILLAGKGHEAYQEIAGTFHPFSDLREAEAALAARQEAA
ncbi:UDP-N-acetylmuramoyl-L-alanyl-D-glutamate--2,6-diaminopimelate ligase [Azospira restricta]|uniref:UDP-N-acetylmuramoyl-L-alanyl-D-glutamate--2,6-diaminopimelate ligase n=1 Tax=Azospira restricta TaxID=404405 RepID=A0A974SNV7_9RHOO|nr:UDP-N-acetylmuramoyl-L-alanyl-D-glutamate--2,6-diaminopimelate ligase [Azospira restricta]QRJ63733.1 UDP-N-acetylmuramoyl-L-alanyl-D-glutamate--2,6-diaminopimelate ligase [Azospira restricta]